MYEFCWLRYYGRRAKEHQLTSSSTSCSLYPIDVVFIIGMSGPHHATAALPPGIETPVNAKKKRLGEPHILSGHFGEKKNFSCPCRTSNPQRSFYTNRAIVAAPRQQFCQTVTPGSPPSISTIMERNWSLLPRMHKNM